MLREGEPLGVADSVTQEVSLAETPRRYERLQKKEPGVLKVVLRP